MKAARRFRTIARAGALLACALLLASCATQPESQVRTGTVSRETPPATPREFRAAWVATVANIDWPSKPGLPVEQQRAEILAILDRAQALNLNAIVFQVRTAADAMYASRLEPWSEYLTGTQGVAPKPFYDPLKVWIDEAHRRGIELHAWLNPYRARHSSAKSPVSRGHLSKLSPNSVKTYGDMLWMDPGDPAARAQTLRVVTDLVTRYDLDGIHIDDYFYPYPVRTAGDFPDDASWRRYLARGGKLDRAAWRRANVDGLIEEMYAVVHRTKPWVRVGISPFGIGRPDRRPAGIVGFSQYDQLYADVELWLQRGWLDYLVPQLYWRIEPKAQSFPVLLQYWKAQNPLGRHVWPGLIPSSINTGARAWPAEEILHQIQLTRSQSDGDLHNGHIHFSMVALMQDRGGVATSLRSGLYAEPALPPPTPWLAGRAPNAVSLSREQPGGVVIRPSLFGSRPTRYAIWKRYGAEWRFSVQSAQDRNIGASADPRLGPLSAVVVSAVDRLGNESARTSITLQ